MKLGISSCLLGVNCHFDDDHAKNLFIVEQLSKYFEFVPFGPKAIVFAILKEAKRSIRSKNIDVVVFASKIKEKYPLLPLKKEGKLADEWLRENFLMQVFAYKNLFEFLKSNPKINDLVLFHTSYKYLIYSKSHIAYKELGNIVANHKKDELSKILADYKLLFLKTIYKKATVSNTYNVLMHIFGYFKKFITSKEKSEILESIQEFKDGMIPLIAVIKIFNLYTKKFNIKYLKEQVFLNPYPKELALKLTEKAYKWSRYYGLEGI